MVVQLCSADISIPTNDFISVHEDCSQTKIHVMKTIRLEVDDLTEIDPDLKVIVLFLEPLANMISIELTHDFWTDENQNENFSS